jgi:hypothetical protein
VHCRHRKKQLKTVRLISLPPGAALTVDGEPKGQTPVTLRLSLGQHKVKIAKDDKTTESTINVTQDDLVFAIPLGAGGQTESPANTNGQLVPK